MDDAALREVRERFDARADSYDSSPVHVALAGDVACFANPTRGSAVLDVATGTGLVLRAMAERFPDRGLTMSGADISPGMLAVARCHLPGVELRVADAAALPFETDGFDLVTCVAALHLIGDVAAMAGECARVLRPGGRLVTATFLASDPAAHGGPSSARNRFDSPEKVAEALSPAGFGPGRQRTFRCGGDALLIAEWRLGRELGRSAASDPR